jgi:hypothetical protein
MVTVAPSVLAREGYAEIVKVDDEGEVILRNDSGDLEVFAVRDSFSGWCIPTDQGRVLEFVRSIGKSDCGRRIRISYDIVTPESAKIGDFAENGWEEEEGICIDPDQYDVEECGSELAAVVALAANTIGNDVEASDYPACCPGHTWYAEIDGTPDYSDGSVKRLSYHLDGFSEEEEMAIYAELCGK